MFVDGAVVATRSVAGAAGFAATVAAAVAWWAIGFVAGRTADLRDVIAGWWGGGVGGGGSRRGRNRGGGRRSVAAAARDRDRDDRDQRDGTDPARHDVARTDPARGRERAVEALGRPGVDDVDDRCRVATGIELDIDGIAREWRRHGCRRHDRPRRDIGVGTESRFGRDRNIRPQRRERIAGGARRWLGCRRDRSLGSEGRRHHDRGLARRYLRAQRRDRRWKGRRATWRRDRRWRGALARPRDELREIEALGLADRAVERILRDRWRSRRARRAWGRRRDLGLVVGSMFRRGDSTARSVGRARARQRLDLELRDRQRHRPGRFGVERACRFLVVIELVHDGPLVMARGASRVRASVTTPSHSTAFTS